MTLSPDRAYDEVLSGLTEYAHDDWLDIDVLINWVRDCFDGPSNYDDVRPVAIRAVRDLINAGAEAGEITEEGFESWPVSSEAMIDRITRALEERTTWPEPNELGWLTFPESEQGPSDG